MPRYVVILADDEIQELKALVQKGGKGYRIRHAQILIKLDQKPENKSWAYDCINIPQADAESVAKMEDVLGVYQRPYDPLNPVVCIDETNKQMIKETRIPCGPGQPERVDSVYIRNGVADVFMISEPLAGRRETIVTESRTALDFAEVLRYTSDVLYPRTEKIILVTDTLNTHSPASLYKAFPPTEARRLAERFEWHYTPKHGSWLDMAEIEIGVMSRQALSKPLPDLESFRQQVRAWTVNRNKEHAKINWQFKTQVQETSWQDCIRLYFEN